MHNVFEQLNPSKIENLIQLQLRVLNKPKDRTKIIIIF